MATTFEIAESEPVPDAVGRLLEGLPEWFGLPEANAQYVRDAERMTTLVARDGESTIVGVLLHVRHFPESAEVHLMAVDRAWHRRGVGRALVERAGELARADGALLQSVKTLGPTSPDENYARTREFYLACGFLPVEELPELWDPWNPCLILVRPLRER